MMLLATLFLAPLTMTSFNDSSLYNSTSHAYEHLYKSAYNAYKQDDCGTALSLFEDLSNKEIGNATNQIGLMYRSGKCRKKDYSKAMDYFLLAKNQGSGIANYNIAGMYILGEGVEIDYEKAFPYLERAASLGIPNATYDIGVSYNDGDGVEADIEKANYWFRKASSLGIGEASFRLGQQLYFDTGNNVSNDINRLQSAKKYLLLGIEQKNSKAAYLLAWGYLNGHYKDKDPEYGVELLKLSAKLGNSEAASVLSDFFLHGIYVEINKEESERYKSISERISRDKNITKSSKATPKSGGR